MIDAMTGNEKLVILGCGPEQLALIREINTLGFYLIGLDGDHSAQGLNLCEEGHITDIKAAKAVAQVLNGDISGILTTTEVALEACAILADEYELPGFKVQTVQIFQNKLAFAQLLKSLNLPYPPFSEITNPGEIRVFGKKHGARLVCKPADASANRGVTILESAGNEHDAFNQAMTASSRGKVMVQSFISGTEHGIECFVNNGKCALMATTDKRSSGLPSCVVLGHRMPSSRHGELRRQLVPQVDRIIQALGITKAQLNFDVIFAAQEAVIIDAGLRPGGNYLQELVSHCYAFSPWKFYVSIFCDGLDQPLPVRPGGFAGCQFILPKTHGILERVLSEKAIGGSIEIHQLKKKGDIIHPVDCAQNRVAVAVVSGSSAGDVDRNLSEFQQHFEVEVA